MLKVVEKTELLSMGLKLKKTWDFTKKVYVCIKMIKIKGV